jgi:hypothetical protein
VLVLVLVLVLKTEGDQSWAALRCAAARAIGFHLGAAANGPRGCLHLPE